MRLVIYLGLLMCLVLTHCVYASPTNSLNKYGEGEMSVLFWELYNAELFGQSAQYQPTSYPQALKITYYRDIEKQDLIKATADQWTHIGFTHPNTNAWLESLNDLWPEIKEGDVLTIVVKSDGSSTFYSQLGELGAVEDKDFGPAFLAIWLSEHTSEPKLRAKLIGIK